ncbi:MAG: hypothetical protein AAGA97_01075 [Pseudomonadota bacterium]
MRYISIFAFFVIVAFWASTNFAIAFEDGFTTNPGKCPEPACVEVFSDDSSLNFGLESIIETICIPPTEIQELSALEVPLSQGVILPRFHFLTSSAEGNDLIILSSYEWCGVRLKLNDSKSDIFEAETHLSNLAGKAVSEKTEGLENQFYEGCRIEFGEGPPSSKTVLGEARSYCAQILDSLGLQVQIRIDDGIINIFAIGNNYLIWRK